MQFTPRPGSWQKYGSVFLCLFKKASLEDIIQMAKRYTIFITSPNKAVSAQYHKCKQRNKFSFVR